MLTCRVESFTGGSTACFHRVRAGMFSTAQDQIRGGGLASPKGDSWSLTGQPFNPSSDILILGTAGGLCCGNGQPAVSQGMVWRCTTILYSILYDDLKPYVSPSAYRYSIYCFISKFEHTVYDLAAGIPILLLRLSGKVWTPVHYR